MANLPAINSVVYPPPMYGESEAYPVEQEKRIKIFQPFMETLAVLQAAFCRPTVLAGGAIRDMFISGPDLIKDLDVFVLGVKDDREKESLRQICHEKLPGGPQYNPYPGTDFGVVWKMRYPAITKNFKWPLMRKIKEKDQYPIQIVAHSAETVEELLADFDWNVCRFAFDGIKIWSEGASDFHCGMLKIGHVRNPFYSLRRGFYLENKFRTKGVNIKLNHEELLTMASMMLLDPEAGKQ